MKNTNIPLLLLLSLSIACTEIVEVDAPQSPSQAIIEGRIIDNGRVSITIKASQPFFENTTLPPITDAEVQLFENDSFKTIVPEHADVPGTYTTRIPTPAIGNTYFLKVTIPTSNTLLPGKTWVSIPDTLKRVFSYDSVIQRELDLTTVPAAFEEGGHALGYFREPPGSGDYYQIITVLNDTFQSTEIFILTDEFVDGLQIGTDFPPLTLYGPFEKPGDELSIFTYSITKNHYDYLTLVQEQTSTGTLFDPPPAPLYGNFYNQDNPDELAFGFFSASSLSLDTLTYRP